jgi:beta-lactamase regulating signal transducer with metallopeptidase domain
MTINQFVELAVSLSTQVALLVAVARLLSRFAHRGETECRLWSGCYLAILLLVLAAVCMPHVRIFRPWSSLDAEVAAQLVTIEIRLGAVLFVVWLVGVAVAAFRFLVDFIETSRFIKTCRPLDGDHAQIESILGRGANGTVGRQDEARILTSSAISGPCCWQFHRPYIVLPEYLLSMDRREIRFVLRHELAHLQTGHPMQFFLERVVEVLFWFHPVVRWSASYSAVARELACDEAAIESPAEVRDYLRTLLAIAERGVATPDTRPASLAFGRSPNVVAQRARRLVENTGEPAKRRRQLTPLPIALCLAAATALASLVWLPADLLASPRSSWSPWPRWSAGVLHNFDIEARDYEVYDRRVQLYELFEERTEGSSTGSD